MKRAYKLENLGCANCAAKMEKDISNLSGVNSARINYMTSKLILDAEDEKLTEVLDESQKIANKYEPDLIIKK